MPLSAGTESNDHVLPPSAVFSTMPASPVAMAMFALLGNVVAVRNNVCLETMHVYIYKLKHI